MLLCSTVGLEHGRSGARSVWSRCLAAVLIVAASLPPALAIAADYAWNPSQIDPGPSDGDGTWNTTTANWWDGAANVAWPNLTTDTAIFGNGGTAGTVTLDGSLSAGSLSFQSVSSGAYQFGGSGTLALASGGAIRFADGATAEDRRAAFNAALSGENIVVEKLGGTLGQWLEFNDDNAFTGTFTVGGAAGGIAVVVSSAGALGTADVTVQSGASLRLTNGITLAAPLTLSGNVVGTNGALQNVSGSNTVSGPVTLAAAARIGAPAGSLTLTNAAGITGTGTNLTLVSAGDLTIAGPIDIAAGSLLMSGTGVTTLSAASTYSGGSNITGGTVAVGNDAAFGTGSFNFGGGVLRSATADPRTIANPIVFSVNMTFGSADTGNLLFTGDVNAGGSSKTFTVANAITEFSGVISGSGGRVKAGAGTLIFSGPNTYTGATTVSAGTLAITNSAALGTDAGGVTVTTAGLLDVSGNISVADAIIIQGAEAGPAATRIVNSAGANTLSGDIALNTGGLDFGLEAAAGTLTVGGSIKRGTATGSRTLYLRGAGTGEVTGVINGSGFTLGIVKEDAGTWTLGAANTHTGPTSVTGGTLVVGDALALQSSPLDTAGGGSVQLASGIVAPTFGGLRGGVDLATKISSGYGSVTGLTLNVASGTSAYSGVIADGAAGTTVTKGGGGIQELSGANTFTGLTTIDNGRLRIASASALGGTASGTKVVGRGSTNSMGLELAAGVTVTGEALELDGGAGRATLFLNENSTWAGDITFTNGTSYSAIQVAGAGIEITGTISVPGSYSGDSLGVGLRGAGDVTVSGPIAAGSNTVEFGRDGGTWILTNSANTFGSASILAGTLRIGGAGQLDGGNYTGTIVNRSRFEYASSADQTLSGVISNTGTLVNDGTGTLTIAGTSNTYTGATTVSSGTLKVTGATPASSAVSVAAGATLAGTGSVGGAATIAGILAPGNSIGVLTLEGAADMTSGSTFAWELDPTQSNPETARGTAYDAVSAGSTFTGTSSLFEIVLTGTNDFADPFWQQDRVWTDIVTGLDGTTPVSGWATAFGGGFAYSYNGQTTAPDAYGSFSLQDSTLTWTAVPEPASLVVVALAAAVGVTLLRRRLDATA